MLLSGVLGRTFLVRGGTLDELMDNIREAAALHLEDELEARGSLSILVLSETEVKGVPKAASS